MGIMVRKLQAVYEGGVLRPVQPLRLDEHQLVSVIIIDEIEPDEELRFEAPEHFEALADHSVTTEAVRRALSKIPGSLDADFTAERNER
jgi:predicted DNA-binding antitoxin AbrB/MazE fold protein